MDIAQKIVVVAGPTGSGKSEVAICLAEEFKLAYKKCKL